MNGVSRLQGKITGGERVTEVTSRDTLALVMYVAATRVAA